MIRYLILTLTLLALTVSSSLRADGERIVIGSDTWCPYTCRTGNGFDGYSVDLIRESLQISGRASEYVNASFSRVLKNVEHGIWHVLPATDASITPELLISQEAVAETSYVFVVPADSDWTFNAGQGLKGMRVGLVNGYGYSQPTELYAQEHPDFVIKITSSTPQRSLLLMLEAGRIDVFPEDRAVVEHWIRQLRLEDKVKFAGIEREFDLQVGVIDDAEGQSLIKIIDQGINILRESGRLQDLKAKYQLD